MHPDISNTFSSSDVAQTFSLLKHMELTVMMKCKVMCVWENMNTHMHVSCVCLITSIKPISDLWLNSHLSLFVGNKCKGFKVISMQMFVQINRTLGYVLQVSKVYCLCCLKLAVLISL